jgi:N-acyl-L-homoserine lactone synthetase
MSRNVSPVDGANVPLLGPFRVEYNVGPASRVDEYRLRYSVFVEERQWLPAGPPGDRLERDEFDEQCCAFLLRDASTGEAAACQRFILPDRMPPGVVTNVERLAHGRSVDLNNLPRHSWAEVSRSTIAPKYRWGSSATPLPAMVAIKYASIALAVALDRSTLFSFSDPRTARLTRRLGFKLHQVGPPLDFHGLRALFKIDVREVLQSVPSRMEASLSVLIARAEHVFTTTARLVADRP